MTLWILIFAAWYLLGLVSTALGEWYNYIIRGQNSYTLDLADLSKFMIVSFGGPAVTIMLVICVFSTAGDLPYFKKIGNFVIFKYKKEKTNERKEN